MAGVSENYQAAQRTARQFSYYLTAVAFTLLALSIRSVPNNIPVLVEIGELTAWLLLTISGFLGLWKLEKMSEIWSNAAERDETLEMLNDLEEIEQESGPSLVKAPDPLDPDPQSKEVRRTANLKQELETKYRIWNDGIGEKRDWIGTANWFQKWLFGIGVVGVIFVRAWPILTSILSGF